MLLRNYNEIRRYAIGLLLLMLFMVSLWSVAPEQAEAAYADGVYAVPYVITKPDDNSVSIANDYFEKPAQIEIVNGTATATIKVNHSAWITSLSLPNGTELAELSANAEEDTRTVRLPLASLDEPALIMMHVLIEDIGYDHAYSVRVAFDFSGIAQASAGEGDGTDAPVAVTEPPSSTESAPQQEEAVEPVATPQPVQSTQDEQLIVEPEPIEEREPTPVAAPVEAGEHVQSNVTAQAQEVPANAVQDQDETQQVTSDEPTLGELQEEATSEEEQMVEDQVTDETVTELSDKQSIDAPDTGEEAGTTGEAGSNATAASEHDRSVLRASETVKPSSSGWSKVAVVGVLLIIPLLLVWRWIRLGRGGNHRR